jgi:hypothetical protein
MQLVKIAAALAALRCAAAVQPLKKHHHAPVKSEPLPAMYTAWRPDAKEMEDVKNGKAVLLSSAAHSHKSKGSKGGDDDDFILPPNLFKVREPKQDFIMDEASNILYAMLSQFASDGYLKHAAQLAKDHHLNDDKQAKVVASLRKDLKDFQKGGPDFMLDAAFAEHPQLSHNAGRGRLVEMLQMMLKNATTKALPQENYRLEHQKKHKKH